VASKRTALLLRCTQEEAAAIRWAANRERRTISGFVLNAIEARIQSHKKLVASFPGWEERNPERGGETASPARRNIDALGVPARRTSVLPRK
jgi:hypothetical protein